MLNFLYIKQYSSPVPYPYLWILDYYTQQKYIKINNYYLFINIYNIIIKNNRYLLNYNYIKNVSKLEASLPFIKNFEYIKKSIKLIGVGYKINKNITNQTLSLAIGYSHILYIKLPINILYSINKENNSIDLISYNKILLTTIVSKLKKLHKNDPYLGKGLKLLEDSFSPKLYKK